MSYSCSIKNEKFDFVSHCRRLLNFLIFCKFMDFQKLWESLLILISSRMWRNLKKQNSDSSTVSGLKYMMGQSCSICLVLFMASKYLWDAHRLGSYTYRYVEKHIPCEYFFWIDCIHQLFLMNRYVKREIHNLARFISVMKFHPLSWRTSHPYVLADRFEDVTPPERVRVDNKCDRNITLYGYLRGCNLKRGTKVCFLYHLSVNFAFWN